MRDRLARFTQAAGDCVPDATAMAVMLLVVLVVASLGLGNGPAATADAFYRGLWMLLAFSMQMTLLLVLSAVLSRTSLFRTIVLRLARLPRNRGQVVLVAVALNAALSYLYWGLGLALGPLIAVHFARAAEERGIHVDFPCLLATVFAASAVWQFGLSSTPVLMAATPGNFLEGTIGILPLSTTAGSPAAILMVAAYALAVAAVAWLMMPRAGQPISHFPDSGALAAAPEPASSIPAAARGIAGWSERTQVFPLLLAAALAGWLYHHFVTLAAGLDLNSMITALLLGALLLQRNLAAFSHAVRSTVQSCWQILVLYQVYGGIAGLLQYTSVGETLARFFAELSSPATFTFLTATAGAVVSLFVPSSGGQWIIQGFVTSESASALGLSAQHGLLALGVGDEIGNLVSPFWIVIAASIARIDFRAMFGYCLIYAALWFVIGVAAFSFVPIAG